MQTPSYPVLEKRFGTIKVECGRIKSFAHLELFFQPTSDARGAILKDNLGRLLTAGIKVSTEDEANDLAAALRWIADELSESR